MNKQDQFLAQSRAAPEYNELKQEKAFAIFYRFNNKWHRCFGYERLVSKTNLKEYLDSRQPSPDDVPDFVLNTEQDVELEYRVGHAYMHDGLVEEFEPEHVRRFTVWRRFDFKEHNESKVQ